MRHIKQFLYNESGTMIANMIFGFFLAFILGFLLVITTFGVSIMRYGYYNRYEAGAALRFGVFSAEQAQAASTNGEDIDLATGTPVINADDVAPYFLTAYQKVMGVSCTSIPGQCTGARWPIWWDGLQRYSPGEQLPNGVTTNQPGFVIGLHIPMFPHGIFANSTIGQNFTLNIDYFVPEQPIPATN